MLDVPVTLLKRGDFVVDSVGGHTTHGLVLSAGLVSYDVVIVGGGTERHRQGSSRYRKVDPVAEGFGSYIVEHLTEEAARAREERRTGARIKRGVIWPSR